MSKLKPNLNPIKFLLIFLIISLSYQASVPPETDFQVLSSRQLSNFELTKEKSEVYYSFQNAHEAADIVLNFKIAKGFTTYCYIYDSYEKIKQDSQGQYIDAIKEFQITENSIILKQSELTIKKAKYYLVIKDLLNSYYKDYISIFNENDTISLSNGQYVQFDQFYSTNTFNLTFTQKQNELATLKFNIDNEDFFQLVTVYTEGGELIYMGEKTRGEILLNEDLDTNGTFIVEIESEEEPYTLMKSSVVLYLEERKAKELKYDSPLNSIYNGEKVFHFYVDLSEYDLNEENIITFKFGKQVHERNLISHCYAKAMNFEINDDNKFIANMPVNEEENEAVFTRLTGTDDVYQLYFKNTQAKEENKTTYLLIHLDLKIDVYDTSLFIEPEEFSVYLSNRAEKIDLVDYRGMTHNILNKNIQIKNYVPVIYRIQLPLEENPLRLSYVFYTSDSVQTIYNTTMISDQHSHEKNRMLYALSSSQNEYDYTKVLYIKIYGFTSGEINFRIESTESNIYYIQNDSRKLKTFSNKLTDCTKSFYYIGDYGSLVTKGYFYQETLYGIINTYYKGKITKDDKSILTNNDSSFLVDSLFPLDTSIDIVELKCEFPGYYQAHLVDDVDKRDINLYSKIYNYLPAKTNFTITPMLSPNQEDINFEIYNPTGKNMKISDGKTITDLDKNKKFYQIKYKNYAEVPSKFTVLSDENSIISITLTNKDSFIIVDKEKADIDYDSQIIIKLAQKKDYSTVNVQITRIYHGFSYSLFRGNVDYAGKLIESQYDYIPADRSHKINMEISNPYLINPNMIKNDENDIYYLMYSIDDPEQIQKEVKLAYNPIEDHEKINPEEIKTLVDEKDIYKLPSSDISLIFQSCGNTLKDIYIKDLGENIIQDIPNSKNDTKYNYEKVKNYKAETNINILLKNNGQDILPELKGAIIGVTEKTITEEKIKYYSDLKLYIRIEDGKITWDKIDQMKSYDIYVLDENNTYIPHLDNPCLLEALKKNYSLFEGNNTYIKHYSRDVNYISLKEQGVYIITVSSKIENDLPLLYVYEPIIYNSSFIPPSPPDGGDDDNDDSGTVLFLAIALPIVIVGVLVIIFALIKCRKKKDDDNMDNNMENDDKNEAIIRDTTISRISEQG